MRDRYMYELLDSAAVPGEDFLAWPAIPRKPEPAQVPTYYVVISISHIFQNAVTWFKAESVILS